MKFEVRHIEWTHEKIGRFWNYISENASLRKHLFGVQAGDHVASVINKTVKFKHLKNVLDLSCGEGDVLSSCLKYLRPGQHIYGTEFSDKNIDTINDRFKNNALFEEAYLLKSYPSPFPDGTFDLVISTEVVEHLNDQDLDLMLKEANRLLAPGGYICVTTPNNEDLAENHVMCPDCGCVFHRWQHVRSWTPHSLQERLKQYSFYPKLVKPIAWSAPLKKRLMLKLAVSMNLVPPSGLVFIGIKEE